MAVVKNRLKIFEVNDSSQNMASTRPPTALKPPNFGGQNMSPALKNFINKQHEASKEDDTSVSKVEFPQKKGPDTPAKGIKNGVSSGANADHNENKTSNVSTGKNVAERAPVVTSKFPENRRISQVTVPAIFQDSASSKIVHRGSQGNGPDTLKNSSEKSSSDENTKPKPTAKPGVTLPRPPPGPKPQSSTADTALVVNKPAPNKNQENSFKQWPPNTSTPVKLPGLGLKQPEEHSTTASKAVAIEHPQPSSIDEKPAATKINTFLLKSQTPETKIALKPVFSTSKKITGVDAVKASDTNTCQDSTKSPNSHNRQDGPALPFRLRGKQAEPSVQDIRQHNESVIERKSDLKRFRKVDVETACPRGLTACDKPALPRNIDLALIKQQYKRGLQMIQDTSDDIYDDCSSCSTGNEMMRKSSNNRPKSDRISIIPDMSAEEEALYDDGATPTFRMASTKSSSSSSTTAVRAALVPDTDEMYVDAETERKEEEEQVYEDEDSLALNSGKLEEENKRRQREEAETKKREEKDRKEKEKEEEKKRKKEEKEKVKREKEEMAQRKKFNLTGTETNVGEGIIKQDVKAGVLGGLSLKKGQTITIVRLDNNPQNKWLIRSDTSMGYIDSSIIEVDPNIIKQAMSRQTTDSIKQSKKSNKDDDDDQPVYDDVPNDGRSTQLDDDDDDGEIYTECP